MIRVRSVVHPVGRHILVVGVLSSSHEASGDVKGPEFVCVCVLFFFLVSYVKVRHR